MGKVMMSSASVDIGVMGTYCSRRNERSGTSGQRAF